MSNAILDGMSEEEYALMSDPLYGQMVDGDPAELNTLDERQAKFDRIVGIDQFEREVTKATIEFSRKPRWLQERLEGDSAWDGSDQQGWDVES